MSVSNIAQGIANAIAKKLGVADEATLFVSDRRLEICATCPSNKHSIIFQTDVCGECGCVLTLKSLSDDPCDLDKW